MPGVRLTAHLAHAAQVAHVIPVTGRSMLLLPSMGSRGASHHGEIVG